MNRRSQPSRQLLAVEVSQRDLRLLLCTRQGDGRVTFTSRRLPWRHDAAALRGAAAVAELTQALKEAVAQWKIGNLPLYVALNGDSCVTRIVTGADGHVQRELGQLEQRSHLYLSLGHGAKTVGGSVRAIDARHQRALLTVVNRNTLDALVEATRAAGLQIALVEPSLVSLARLAGKIGLDHSEPVLLVHAGESGVEVGLSHDGQLLLDYRPAGGDLQTQVDALVKRHLGRLQRYCDRYMRFTEGRFRRVFLSGDDAAVEQIRQAFGRDEDLSVEPIRLDRIDAHWDVAAVPLDTAAAIGVALRAGLDDETYDGPNLMERLQTQHREGVVGGLIRLCWPVAAVLLIALCAWGVAWQQKSRCRAVEQRVEALADARREARMLQHQMTRDTTLLGYYDAIRNVAAHPDWSGICEQLGQCVPDDVWFEQFLVDDTGRVVVRGASFSDEGVFELVAHLRAFPAVARVALESTQPLRTPAGLATKFELSCDLAGYAVQED